MIKRALILAATIGLSGCVSLFPKADPATLYKLTGATVASIAPSGPAASTVLKAPTAFTRVGASDRILTTAGTQTAYLAGARWAAPAQVMFDEALASAFTSAAPAVRLVTRGEVTPVDQVLRVDVRTFEAQYRSGRKSAPIVVVEARASLVSLRDRAPAGDQVFRAEAPAASNRVGSIVSAFDIATAKVLGDIARWTESQAPAKAAS